MIKTMKSNSFSVKLISHGPQELELSSSFPTPFTQQAAPN